MSILAFLVASLLAFSVAHPRERGRCVPQSAFPLLHSFDLIPQGRCQGEGFCPDEKSRYRDCVRGVGSVPARWAKGKRPLDPKIRVLRRGLGSHLERVIRSMSRPIMVTTAEFRAPKRIMLAFDGSATTRKGVDMVAASPLFRGLPCHLVMVGADTTEQVV